MLLENTTARATARLLASLRKGLSLLLLYIQAADEVRIDTVSFKKKPLHTIAKDFAVSSQSVGGA